MRYLNASQAAKRIGVADKTIRRWLQEGEKGKWKLTAVRTTSNQLAIAESDVERIKRELEKERSQFVTSDQSADSLDMSGHNVEALEARIKELEQEVATLKERVTTLEQEKVIVQGKSKPILASSTSDTSPVQRAQKRTTERTIEVPSELPAGSLPATDFAAHIGMSYDHLKNFIRRGVSGQRLDITEVPHPTKKKKDSDEPTMQYFLTLSQQEAARALLRRHGKLPDETSE